MGLKIDHCGTPDLIVAGLIVPLLISLLCVDPGCIKQGFDIMRQSACLVLNPITVYSYGFLFNCTMVGQASDSIYDGSNVKL